MNILVKTGLALILASTVSGKGLGQEYQSSDFAKDGSLRPCSTEGRAYEDRNFRCSPTDCLAFYEGNIERYKREIDICKQDNKEKEKKQGACLKEKEERYKECIQDYQNKQEACEGKYNSKINEGERRLYHTCGDTRRCSQGAFYNCRNSCALQEGEVEKANKQKEKCHKFAPNKDYLPWKRN